MEGYSDRVYPDHKGNPTIGHGLNLNDKVNQKLLTQYGYKVSEITSGRQSISLEDANSILNQVISKKEKQIRKQIGSSLFDSLQPNEKAAVMSLGYQSLKLLGPKLRHGLARNNAITVLRAIILESNPENKPGVLARRLKEAELFGDPVGFAIMMGMMTTSEKQRLLKIINKNKNLGQKQAMLEKYSPFLTQTVPSVNYLVTFNFSN